MDNVKRYTTAEIRYDTQGGSFVRATSFDALREELAVARSDISTWRIHHDRKSVALDVAEQRNAELVELLRGACGHYSVLTGIILTLSREDHLSSESMRKSAYAACDHGNKINAVLKPTESGASE